MKYLYIVGACGSIGTQTLDIVRENPNDFSVIGMSVGSNLKLAKELVEEFKPEIVCCKNIDDKLDLSYNPIIVYGDNGLLEVSKYKKYDNEIFVNALVGIAGLLPTIEAIKTRKIICLANKETLVVAGDIINQLVNEYKVELIPIDSEHSAILQCLAGETKKEVRRIIITASGGSFRDKTRNELLGVRKEAALNHPNWNMGSKITIDSATMMNKGFEVIEAHYLFNLPYEKIETILHPQSIVHSMVEFDDLSIKAQVGTHDMHIPISYALYFPHHQQNNISENLNFIGLSLDFKELSFERFPCLKYAYDAAKKGGIYLTVLNAANEAAVYLFLNDKIEFLDIERIIDNELSKDYSEYEYTLDNIVFLSKKIIESIILEHGGKKL